jgi:hypothetical protein
MAAEPFDLIQRFREATVHEPVDLAELEYDVDGKAGADDDADDLR